MRKRKIALTLAGAVTTLALAGTATATTNIHFYTFEDPGRQGKTKTVDVVPRNTNNPNEQAVNTCKNVRIGRDFYNESGRHIQLHRSPNCREQNPVELHDGEELHNSTGFQSVYVAG